MCKLSRECRKPLTLGQVCRLTCGLPLICVIVADNLANVMHMLASFYDWIHRVIPEIFEQNITQLILNLDLSFCRSYPHIYQYYHIAIQFKQWSTTTSFLLNFITSMSLWSIYTTSVCILRLIVRLWIMKVYGVVFFVYIILATLVENDLRCVPHQYFLAMCIKQSLLVRAISVFPAAVVFTPCFMSSVRHMMIT